MLVTSSLPALINGVSQQPDELRDLSQVSAQSNCHSSEVDGLVKRPPLAYDATLDSTEIADAFVHVFQDSTSTQYTAMFTGTSVRVFDRNGVEQTVNAPGGFSYLGQGSDSIASKLRAITVADYTFVTNKDVDIALSSTLTPQPAPQCFVFVKSGQYSRTYQVHISVGGTQILTASYTTPDGTTSGDAAKIQTTAILGQLASQLSSGTPGNGFTVTSTNDYILIVSNSASQDFSVSFDDGESKALMNVVKGSVQSLADLPNTAPDGFQVEIIGDSNSNFDNYYATFTKNNSTDSTGVWKESAAPGVDYEFDATTMPYNLIREADGSFTWTTGAWKHRTVGDETSAPAPSFVGSTIQDLFIFRNRLGMLSQGNTVLSQAGDLFNFWATTVTTVVNDDPLDIASAGSVATLNAATPIANHLLLWGEKTQLELSTQTGILSAPDTSIEPVSDYEADDSVRPVVLGIGAFFVRTVGEFTRLQELQPKPGTRTFEAENVTAQAPRYFPGNTRVLAGSEVHNMVASLSDLSPTSIFVYKFFRLNGHKIQSAAYRWDYPSDWKILSVSFYRDRMIVLWTQTGLGTFLGHIPLNNGEADPDATYLTHLDRKVDESKCTKTLYPYDQSTGLPQRTRITLPYAINANTKIVSRVNGSDTSWSPAVTGQVVQSGTDWIEVQGDWTTSSALFYAGDTYTMNFELSTIYLRKQLVYGGPRVAVVAGRLQLRYLTFNYTGTGVFTVTVTPYLRDPVSAVSTGRLLGSTTLGQLPVFASGSYRVPVNGRNTDITIDVTDDSFLPAKFQTIEWEGFYSVRDRLM